MNTQYGSTWLVVCRYKDECSLDCSHKVEHHPFKDGGCLPCDCHIHVCLDRIGKYTSHEGKCVFVRRIIGGQP